MMNNLLLKVSNISEKFQERYNYIPKAWKRRTLKIHHKRKCALKLAMHNGLQCCSPLVYNKIFVRTQRNQESDLTKKKTCKTNEIPESCSESSQTFMTGFVFENS